MQNDENAVIRYLMKEMDPSEEVLMERAMMEDEDLLIEVESMRQTLHRLDDLPEKEPPKDLCESIIQQAAEHKNNASRWPSIPSVPSQVYKYAAVLLIGMGLGSGIWMFLDSSETQDSLSDEAAIFSNFDQNTPNNADTEPWVDRDDVIYFQDMFNQGATGYNTILETSRDKLTPVKENVFQLNPNSRNVQLTGSDN